MPPPDILNSKIKKIRIELPHYTFSHSSSGDSPHDFIGRERICEKLKRVIEDSPEEPGVYLVAGNRGVGKTSLVSQVIKETSFQPKSKFTENIKFLVLLFLAVVGTHFCLFVLKSLFFTSKEHSTIFDTVFNVIWTLIFVLSFILLCCFNSYRCKITKKSIGLKIWDGIASAFKELGYLVNQDYPYGKSQYVLKISLAVSFSQLFFDTPIKAFVIYLFIVLICKSLFLFLGRIINKKKKSSKDNTSFFTKFKKIFLLPIRNYIKNHNRLYLRINFGHKLKDEKDILRLITYTLGTEYNKFRRSLRRRFLWRIIAASFLLLFASLFSYFVKGIMYKDHSNVILPTDSKIIIVVADTDLEFKKDISVIVKKTLHIPNQLVFRIMEIIKGILKYFWDGSDEIIKSMYHSIDIFFLMSFFLMYLLCKLLFRLAWTSNLFVTHGIIMRQLKRLNSDITYSTERENSIGLNIEKVVPSLGIRTRKSRNIADAREIEKELQDILDDIQRIPIIMCRPNIVIVFDELDKVEPSEAGQEKENPQTKSSMFSINAVRERQTEILRILSNLKYFLSTAKAKFIFIAGREMYDIHLADVSERNNYIGSIFNVVILVPSFLTDHQTGEYIPQESSIASLPEEFVCRKLFPHNYIVDFYNLKNYRIYLEDVIYRNLKDKVQKNEIIQKIIAVLQQFIIYLAHLSKGAPKKMTQLFEAFVEIKTERENEKNMLLVQNLYNSRHFLSFNYYKQYTIGIVAYLITPIFYRLAESNIKEHSDKLIVSSLRFVDFLFKFHKNSFSWKHLDMSPEMLEVNRAPELKSVAVDLLNYLAQVHINKSNFSLSDYKFDGLIANEIFAMAKTDDVFSALFSFSLDEMLPLKNHYKELLRKTENEYQNNNNSLYIDAISSLQGVIGDLYYYDDGLEEAEAYYKRAVHALREKEELKIEELYVYVRNMLRLGIIYEKRKQYDFAYLAYGELCERVIRERDIAFNKLGVGLDLRKINNKNEFVKASSKGYISKEEKEFFDYIKIPDRENEEIVDSSIATLQPLNFMDISPITNKLLFKKMTFEGLKLLYLSFIAKFQIIEKSHVGGITHNHLKQLEKEFKLLTYIIDQEEANLIESEFYSRVADILYYKNSDLKCKKTKNRLLEKEEDELSDDNENYKNEDKYISCTACYYYHRALSILLGKYNFNKEENKNENTVIKLLIASVKNIKENYNMKFCTILARILSDWGNVFFSCDNKNNNYDCYICDKKKCNTQQSYKLEQILEKYINYLESESKDDDSNVLISYFNNYINKNITKLEISFAMYSISLEAYRKANLYKRSSFQIYKTLCLIKHYKIFNNKYIKRLSKIAIHYLLYANEDLKLLELNKRKKDFGKETIIEKDNMPLQNLLLDSEIIRIRILVKELEFRADLKKSFKEVKDLTKYYDLRITSPYRINYSIVGRIYRLWLKSKVNYEVYKLFLKNIGITGNKINEKIFTLEDYDYEKLKNDNYNKPLRKYFENNGCKVNNIDIFENLIAETIYCLIDITQLTETMDETYIFTHSFLGTIHDRLSFWIRQYEAYEEYIKENKEMKKQSKIKKYLEQYLDEEWREQLSGYRENQRALSRYYKSLEMHNEGRAYHNMIDTMVYIKDDFNDRSDHFNIAEERHLVVNRIIYDKINKIQDIAMPHVKSNRNKADAS